MAHDGNVDAAILNLFASFPNEFNGLWHTINELTDHIHDGGVVVVPRSAVANFGPVTGVHRNSV
jgi:hypothetical protein